MFITANISGGHINPSVTIATMLSGHISILKGLCYVVGQVVGSILASMLVVRACDTLRSLETIGRPCYLICFLPMA